MTVNAPFGHRAGLRDRGNVRYLGWAVPEAVYVDFDVIQQRPAAPQPERRRRHPLLPHRPRRLADRPRPRSGGDTLAVRPAAGRRGADPARRCPRPSRRHPRRQRGRHPDPDARPSLGRRDVPQLRLEPAPHRGRRALPLLQPRAADRPPLHPRPAGRARDLRGSILQDNEPEAMLAALVRAGVDIRPEAMGVTWDDVAEALRTLPAFVRAGRPVVHGRRRPADRRRRRRRASATGVTGGYGPWEGGAMKVGITLPQGCDREYLGIDAATRLGADGRRRPAGRGARVRIALGLRPHAGRPAARGGADLRADRRARGDRDGDVAGPARPSRARRRVSERRR